MKKRIVVALGGNALGNNAEEQRELVRQTAVPIVDLIAEGHELVLAHGNGPQVGMINLAFDNPNVPPMPFPECGAMSQGYIGYHLQNAIREELLSRGLSHPVATIVTQVVVDIEDPAFQNPTKPIGSFYSEEKAKEIAKETGFVMKEDSGRGYRRVVASPKPIAVVEDRTVNALIEAGQVVITVGGGGIPVIRQGIHLEGVAAVIDKDFASEVLAEMVDADYLIILTAVEKVALNFGKKDEKWLDHVTVAEMEQYMTEGHFAPGSMLPKVEASVAFAKSKEGRTALITSLENARDGIAGKTGTHISI
ncbi:MAG: carbamate kinase [Clostridiales bacterium]|jgi:carbamate kinase|nr:carbamate kinase [Clostridiales bacterium]MDD2571943.1 carbamate kinase [Eubacteriales bacterium]NLG29942.1 carbamate kinase [Clostridiaceae bacterium]MCK9349793.1 carbamate kinase [Clostridiales bacterium]MDD3418554.1 carbamate kinase [Eubacteriales bacterium]